MPQTLTTTALNYLGLLYRLGRRSNTLLKIVGGISANDQGDIVQVGAGWRSESNYEFATNLDFNLEAPSQTGRLESGAAPAPGNTTPSQSKNVIQVFHESVDISYLKMSTPGRFTGVQTAGQTPTDTGRAFQINRRLEKIAQDVNYSFLLGAYNNPADPAVDALLTRGLLTAITTNVLANGGTARALTDQLLNDLYKEMIDNAGVQPEAMVALMNTKQMGVISQIYKDQFQTGERMVGGLMVRTVYTAYGVLNVALELDMPQDQIAYVNADIIEGVYNNVEGKPTGLFYEALAKVGSSEKGQIYGQLGFDHGPEWGHGLLSDLS